MVQSVKGYLLGQRYLDAYVTILSLTSPWSQTNLMLMSLSRSNLSPKVLSPWHVMRADVTYCSDAL